MVEESWCGGEVETLIAVGKKLDRAIESPRQQSIERPDAKTVRQVLAESLLKIRGKSGELRALELNAAQREFERKCGRRNIELKVHMRWVVGNGNQGKMQELEQRMEKQEASLHRVIGIGGAVGALITFGHVALDYVRSVQR